MDVRSSGAYASRRVVRVRESIGAIVCALLLACLCVALPARLFAQSSICAEVKIQIDQKVSLERQAFDATLRIRNGLEGVQVERLDVNLVFKDMSGAEASALFYNRIDTTDGISGSVEDGSGTVPAATTGEAHWLIVPSTGAGGDQGNNYQIGATVTYRMTGDTEDRTVEVIPEIITVRPQPKLRLDYFLPGYVYGDDPLTGGTVPEVAVPFTLGVRITNTGYGIASHATIESAQPKIVKNDQGLLIGFQIASSYVDDEPSQPSLLIDFGDIDPGTSRMGRWSMTTSLSGQFFDFEAEYTHADDLGGALTSLIDPEHPPATHLLAHDVLVDLPERDQVRDFLALDGGEDWDHDTYRVFESEGGTEEVATEFNASFDGSHLTFPSTSSGILLYVRANTDWDGQGRTLAATRSDGTPVPTDNIWFSKRRTPDGAGWIKFINLFEAQPFSCGGSTCSYDVTYDGVPAQASLSGVVYEDANANGSYDEGELGIATASVTLNGADGPRSVATATDGTFHFAGLAAGTYSLTVGSVSGHYDGAAAAGTAGGAAGVATISGIVIGATTQAIDYRFAKVPNPTQRVADLALTALTASTSSPRVGATFTLNVQIANAGPDTTPAEVVLTLPASIEVLAANPSSGTYDLATKHWAVGDLPLAGSAALSLEVRASSEGDSSISAAVSSSNGMATDPTATNNLAQLPLHVVPSAEVRVTPSFLKESRILAWTASQNCPNPIAICAPGRLGTLEAVLTSTPNEHFATDDSSVFLAELRSGHWNVYWIDDSAAGHNPTVLMEAMLAVFRGDSLILDGSYSLGDFGSRMGFAYNGLRSIAPAEALTFTAGDPLEFPGMVVSGSRYAYQVTTGTIVATYPDQTPAIFRSIYGQGRVLVFAYDLLASLTNNSAYAPFLDQITTSMQPVVPASFAAGTYVPVKLHLENLGDPLTVNEVFSVPIGASIIRISSAGTQGTSQQASWQADLVASATFDASAGILTPPIGASSLTIDVTQVGGQNGNLAHEELALGVKVSDTQLTVVQNEISSLQVAGSQDSSLRSDAVAALEASVSARNEGALGDTLDSLLAVEAALSQITSVDVAAVRVDLTWLLKAYEREWYSALSTCDPAGVSVVKDRGLSFLPMGEYQGLYEHQEAGNGSEWVLGFDTEDSHLNVSTNTRLTAGKSYQWTLSYDGANGSLTVEDDGTTVAELAYSGDSAVIGFDRALSLGNAVELSIEAGTNFQSIPPGPQPEITIGTTAINGVPLADSIGTSASSSDPLVYYSEGMAGGLTLSGTIEIGKMPPDGYSSFRVRAGNVSCKLPER